jgi:hypothetical protein
VIMANALNVKKDFIWIMEVAINAKETALRA